MTPRFSIRRQVEFNHCDPAGLVFYPRYYEMISALLERFFADGIGRSWQAMGQGGLVTPMGRIETRFVSPSRLGDWLELSLEISRLGSSSATFDLECRGETGLRFTGAATMVCADMTIGRAAPWPDPIRAAMQPFLSTAPSSSDASALAVAQKDL